jgi:hypothetical protein
MRREAWEGGEGEGRKKEGREGRGSCVPITTFRSVVPLLFSTLWRLVCTNCWNGRINASQDSMRIFYCI